MVNIAVVDLEGTGNAPVAVTLDVFRICAMLTGAPVARVGCFGRQGAAPRNLRQPWSAFSARWDVVIVPGLGLAHAQAPWDALATVAGQRLVAALAQQHARGALLAASCTGTFALAEAGLLEGRRATTSWWLAAEFRQRYPSVALREGALTTEDDRVLCAGGSLAHVDLMLVLTAKLFHPQLASRVAQYLVSPSRGPQSVVAEVSQTRITDPHVAAAVQLVQARIAEDFSIEELAQAVSTSPRTLHRRIHASLGLSVVGLVRRIRGEEAMRLLRETDLPLSRIADRVGYQNESSLRSLIVEVSGQTPASLRRQGHGRVG
jgi:transcriptional regulator GlxA family with amidase domain